MILKNIDKIENRKTAIIYITEKGRNLAEKLKKYFPNSEIFPVNKNLDEIFIKTFKEYKSIIAVMATGIVVRKIAPLLQSKAKDPAIIVLDEKEKFAISLLSGHIGRANELTLYISKKTGATPVITTATDVNKKFAIDIIPARTGWIIENKRYIKKINSAILNNEQIATNISKDFLLEIFPEYDTDIFKNFIFYKNLGSLAKSKIPFKVVVSNKLDIKGDFLLFRPKNIYIGLGCNRGTSLEEIENVIFETLKKLNRSYKSVNSISSFELKADEPALIEFSIKHGIQLIFYNKNELNSVADSYKTSSYLIKNLGVKGVCEPSAILSARKDMKDYLKRKTLLVKQKKGNVTIAIQELLFS